ncbi:hypothetical protein WJX77_000900 [Trebouxia sp. C0004]
MPDTLVKTKVMHLMRYFSGQHCVESTLYLAETFWQSSPFMLQRYGLGWWALQLPTVCFIVGSSSFRQFEQQVMNAELE